MRKRSPASIRFVLALSTLLIALALSATHAVAGNEAIGILGAKKSDGPYRGNQEVTVSEGKTKVVYWRVINPEGSDQEITLSDDNTDNQAGYKLKWYSGTKPKPSKDITSEVADTAQGFDFTLAAGDTRAFSTEVKANDTSDDNCLLGRAVSSTFGLIRTALLGINGPCT